MKDGTLERLEKLKYANLVPLKSSRSGYRTLTNMGVSTTANNHTTKLHKSFSMINDGNLTKKDRETETNKMNDNRMLIEDHSRSKVKKEIFNDVGSKFKNFSPTGTFYQQKKYSHNFPEIDPRKLKTDSTKNIDNSSYSTAFVLPKKMSESNFKL